MLADDVGWHGGNVSVGEDVRDGGAQAWGGDGFVIGALDVGDQLDEGLLASALPPVQQVVPRRQVIPQLDNLSHQFIEVNVIELLPVPPVLWLVVFLYPLVYWVE